MLIEHQIDCPLYDSPRVRQVAAMFDVPLAERMKDSFRAELPSLNDDWTIGAIVGPSASGKTTIARRAYGEHFAARHDWPADRAVIDCIANLPANEVVRLLTSVGFSSPPSWIKPYRVLSGGEQFRCELARAVADAAAALRPLVVVDEFTSLLDRRAATIGAAAIAKAIRSGQLPLRLVAVTCHRDIVPWLAPDWVVEMPRGELSWRRLRRPAIELEVRRATPDAWPPFARHHYLSGSLSPLSECYLATWHDEPVAFCAVLALIGRKGRRRISRLVVLPEFQGIGIGMRLAETVGQVLAERGLRLNVTGSHPALLAHCRDSQQWRFVQLRRRRACDAHRFVRGYRNARQRMVWSFEYVGVGEGGE
jgi:GNAT superfamily N-acetyltransferase